MNEARMHAWAKIEQAAHQMQSAWSGPVGDAWRDAGAAIRELLNVEAVPAAPAPSEDAAAPERRTPSFAALAMYLGDCGLNGPQQHEVIHLVNAMLRATGPDNALQLSDLLYAFIAGAHEQRENPTATLRDANRAADAYVKHWLAGANCTRCGGKRMLKAEGYPGAMVNCPTCSPLPGQAEDGSMQPDPERGAPTNQGLRKLVRAWGHIWVNHLPDPGTVDAPEERDGAAGNFEVALRKYVESAIAHRWANEDDPDYAAIRGRCERYRQRVLRLHREAGRAEMGEVVGRATVTPHWEDGDEYLPHITPHMNCANGSTEPYTVDLVRRRDKEGV